MRIISEAMEEHIDLFMHHRVVRNSVFKFSILLQKFQDHSQNSNNWELARIEIVYFGSGCKCEVQSESSDLQSPYVVLCCDFDAIDGRLAETQFLGRNMRSC